MFYTISVIIIKKQSAANISLQRTEMYFILLIEGLRTSY